MSVEVQVVGSKTKHVHDVPILHDHRHHQQQKVTVKRVVLVVTLVTVLCVAYVILRGHLKLSTDGQHGQVPGVHEPLTQFPFQNEAVEDEPDLEVSNDVPWRQDTVKPDIPGGEKSGDRGINEKLERQKQLIRQQFQLLRLLKEQLALKKQMEQEQQREQNQDQTVQAPLQPSPQLPQQSPGLTEQLPEESREQQQQQQLLQQQLQQQQQQYLEPEGERTKWEEPGQSQEDQFEQELQSQLSEIQRPGEPRAQGTLSSSGQQEEEQEAEQQAPLQHVWDDPAQPWEKLAQDWQALSQQPGQESQGSAPPVQQTGQWEETGQHNQGQQEQGQKLGELDQQLQVQEVLLDKARQLLGEQSQQDQGQQWAPAGEVGDHGTEQEEPGQWEEQGQERGQQWGEQGQQWGEQRQQEQGQQWGEPGQLWGKLGEQWREQGQGSAQRWGKQGQEAGQQWREQGQQAGQQWGQQGQEAGQQWGEQGQESGQQWGEQEQYAESAQLGEAGQQNPGHHWGEPGQRWEELAKEWERVKQLSGQSGQSWQGLTQQRKEPDEQWEDQEQQWQGVEPQNQEPGQQWQGFEPQNQEPGQWQGYELQNQEPGQQWQGYESQNQEPGKQWEEQEQLQSQRSWEESEHSETSYPEGEAQTDQLYPYPSADKPIPKPASSDQDKGDKGVPWIMYGTSESDFNKGSDLGQPVERRYEQKSLAKTREAMHDWVKNTLSNQLPSIQSSLFRKLHQTLHNVTSKDAAKMFEEAGRKAKEQMQLSNDYSLFRPHNQEQSLGDWLRKSQK